MPNTKSSPADLLLKLTYETDQALREGRLGAEEWFTFVENLESLACKLDAQPRMAKKTQNPENHKDEENKDKEGRILPFSPSAPALLSVQSTPCARASSAARSSEER